MPATTALEKAKTTARAAGLFFLRDPYGFVLYRRMPVSRVFLGRAHSPDALRKLVSRCARTTSL